MTAILGLVLIVCFTTGALKFPDFRIFRDVLAGEGRHADDRWLAASIDAVPEGSPVLLPPGATTVRWNTLAVADSVRLQGAGVDRTLLEILDSTPVLTTGPAGQSRPADRIACGTGAAACVLNDHVTLSNLTVTRKRF